MKTKEVWIVLFCGKRLKHRCSVNKFNRSKRDQSQVPPRLTPLKDMIGLLWGKGLSCLGSRTSNILEFWWIQVHSTTFRWYPSSPNIDRLLHHSCGACVGSRHVLSCSLVLPMCWPFLRSPSTNSTQIGHGTHCSADYCPSEFIPSVSTLTCNLLTFVRWVST